MARNFNHNLGIYRIPQLSGGLLAGIRGFSTHISQYYQVLGVYFSNLGAFLITKYTCNALVKAQDQLLKNMLCHRKISFILDNED